MSFQTLTSANLDTATQNAALLLIAHNGGFDKKLKKAINSVAENEFAVATLDFTDDPAAIEALDIHDGASTLIVFEDGDEIGRIFRPKAKDVYVYADFLNGTAPQPDDRTADQKANVGNTVVKPMHVTQKNFKAAVLRSNLPVLVDMWAPWCGPCNAIAPALDRLAGELDGKAKIAKVNVDENPRLSNKFGVRSIPTMIIFKKGKEVDRLVGALPANQIRQRLEEWM